MGSNPISGTKEKIMIKNKKINKNPSTSSTFIRLQFDSCSGKANSYTVNRIVIPNDIFKKCIIEKTFMKLSSGVSIPIIHCYTVPIERGWYFHRIEWNHLMSLIGNPMDADEWYISTIFGNKFLYWKHLVKVCLRGFWRGFTNPFNPLKKNF